MKRKMIEWWKNSQLFAFVDRIISTYFRKKLTNKDFTILCPNCIGGVVYHRLGCRFLSPTINMWLVAPDFVRFLLHLDAYLALPLVFVDSVPCPVAVLGGGELPEIRLNFNHAKSEDEARDAWERRKNRIRKDNLYIMMYMLDGVTEEEVHALDDYPCQNKVIFTHRKDVGIDWAYYIEPNMRAKYPYNYLDKDFFGIRRFEKKFDFVAFLNQKREPRA